MREFQPFYQYPLSLAMLSCGHAGGGSLILLSHNMLNCSMRKHTKRSQISKDHQASRERHVNDWTEKYVSSCKHLEIYFALMTGRDSLL